MRTCMASSSWSMSDEGKIEKGSVAGGSQNPPPRIVLAPDPTLVLGPIPAADAAWPSIEEG